MKTPTPPRMAALIAGLIASGALCAQEKELGTLRITADRESPSATQPDIAAAKREISTVAGGASVIDAEDFRTGRVSTFPDALGQAVGVFAQSRFGAEEARVSIRGSGLQRTFHMRGIKLMQDGVPLNLADGGADFQAVEPLAARYLTVHRGANALEHGATTLGGAINYVSPTGHTAAPAEIRTEAGSRDYRRLYAHGAGVWGEGKQFDGFISGSYFAQEGFRDHSQQEAARVMGNFGIRAAENVETRFYLAHATSNSELPGAITKTQLRNTPRMANAGAVAGDQKRDIDLTRIANKTTVALGQGVLEFSAFYSHKKLFHPIFQVLDQDSDDYGAGIRYTLDTQLGGRRNVLTVGYLPTRGTIEDVRWQNLAGKRGAQTANADELATNHDVYFENQHYVLPQMALIVGAQHTTARRKLDDNFNASAASKSFDETFHGTSPKVGIRYDYLPNTQFFANYSYSFEPPSFGELNGTGGVVNVKEQKGRTFEIGARGNAALADWDVALYAGKVRDEMLCQSTTTPTSCVTINAPRTVHRGIEAGLTLRPVSGVEWRNALLVNDFRYDNDPRYDDNRLPGIPRTFLRSELTWRIGDLYVAGTAEWSPQRYAIDMENSFHADRYAIYGLKIGSQLRKGMSWFVEGRNLADRRYAATTGVISNAQGTDKAQFYPGDGRAVFAGLQWRM